MIRKCMLFSALIIVLAGCKGSLPEKEDFLGSYRLIKIRENGKILNLDTLSAVELTDQLYISAIDRNGDFSFSEDEATAVSYTFLLDDENRPYLEINRDETPVFLESDHYFDLILRRIDPLGNETLMYLKK